MEMERPMKDTLMTFTTLTKAHDEAGRIFKRYDDVEELHIGCIDRSSLYFVFTTEYGIDYRPSTRIKIEDLLEEGESYYTADYKRRPSTRPETPTDRAVPECTDEKVSIKEENTFLRNADLAAKHIDSIEEIEMYHITYVDKDDAEYKDVLDAIVKVKTHMYYELKRNYEFARKFR
jgi:hypothetical protein